MTSEVKSDWLAEAISRAKESALPLLLESLSTGDEDADGTSLVLAIELALLAVTGVITEEKLRAALRPIAEPLAEAIGATWEAMADAIVGTLEWVPPDLTTHILNSWK